MTMFEDAPSAKPGIRWNKQALLLWGLLVAVSLPGAFFGWRYWNQRRAIALLDEYRTALAVYNAKFEGYPDSLERLRGAEDTRREGGPPENARLLPTSAAKDQLTSHGYRFTYKAERRVLRWAASVPLYAEYSITAVPSNFVTAWLHLGTDESGDLIEARTAEALAEKREMAQKAQDDARKAPEGDEEESGLKVTATPAEQK